MDIDVHQEKSPLSRAENRLLPLMAKGLSRPEMAKYLFVSLSTINTHVNHIFDKLEADNNANAVFIATVRGILSAKQLMVSFLIVCSLNGALSSSAEAGQDDGSQDDNRVFRIRASQRGRGRHRVRVRSVRLSRSGREFGVSNVLFWLFDSDETDVGKGWVFDAE